MSLLRAKSRFGKWFARLYQLSIAILGGSKTRKARLAVQAVYRYSLVFMILIIENLSALVVLIVVGTFYLFVSAFVPDFPNVEGFAERVVSVTYPHNPGPRIGVVLATDDLLRKGLPAPLPYDVDAQIVRAIIPYQPALFFMDFYFEDERRDPELPALVNALKDLHGGGTLIYVGTTPDRELIPEFYQLVRSGVVVPVFLGWDKETGRYKLNQSKQPADSFALIAYKDLCSRSVILHCGEVKKPGDMKIWWGAPPADAACSSPEAASVCDAISSGPFLRLQRLIERKAGKAGANKVREADPISVFYHPAISVDELLSGHVEPIMATYLPATSLQVPTSSISVAIGSGFRPDQAGSGSGSKGFGSRRRLSEPPR